MNLVEKLKNVPQGTELRCLLFKDPVILHTVTPLAPYPISVKTSVGERVFFNKEGHYSSATASQNCMLYPPMMNSWHNVEYIPDGKLVVCERDNKIIQIGRAKGGFAWSQINVYWWYDLETHKLNVDGSFYFNRQVTEQEYTDIRNILIKEVSKMIGPGLKRIYEFKKGDIIVSENGTIAIFDSLREGMCPDVVVYKAIRETNGKIKVKTDVGIGYASHCRPATEEEKNLLFNSLAEAGYIWNGEEVIPIFKKGDIIASDHTVSIVDHIADLGTSKNVIYYQACINASGRLKMGVDCGVGNTRDNRNATNGEKARILRMLAEAGYEFDGVNVTRKEYQFEPFEQVLVRDSFNEKWKTAHYSHREGSMYIAGGTWLYCIPYNEETKHLRGTSLDAPKKYK